MKNKDVVLNRAGVIQLAGGMFSLLVLGFLAGAVVGFEAGGGVADGSGLVPTNGGATSDLATTLPLPESAAERETPREAVEAVPGGPGTGSAGGRPARLHAANQRDRLPSAISQISTKRPA